MKHFLASLFLLLPFLAVAQPAGVVVTPRDYALQLDAENATSGTLEIAITNNAGEQVWGNVLSPGETASQLVVVERFGLYTLAVASAATGKTTTSQHRVFSDRDRPFTAEMQTVKLALLVAGAEPLLAGTYARFTAREGVTAFTADLLANAMARHLEKASYDPEKFIREALQDLRDGKPAAVGYLLSERTVTLEDRKAFVTDLYAVAKELLTARLAELSTFAATQPAAIPADFLATFADHQYQ